MKKSICFLTDSIFSIGGVQRVTAVMAKALCADGYRVAIVTLDKPEAQDTTLYGLGEAAIDYHYLAYPDTPAWKQLFCKAYSLLYRKCLPQTRFTSRLYAHSSFPSEKRDALARVLRAGRFDVVVGVHAPLAVRLAACRQQLPGVKLMGWIHNSHEALFGQQSPYLGSVLRRHYEQQLQTLDRTIVLCQYDAERYPFPTQVVYNPLTLTPGPPSRGTSKRFLAVGRFTHLHKGFDLLIDAFHLFAVTDNEWTLDIVGEGPEEALYREKIAQYGLGQRVRLHPFTNNIQPYYSEAQVYVLSSRWEGFGLVLVEAMAHGLPVVSSDLPTSEELLGDFGLYFENGNVEQLAERLKEATQIDWPKKSAEAIRIAQRFDISKIILQWKEILSEHD